MEPRPQQSAAAGGTINNYYAPGFGPGQTQGDHGQQCNGYPPMQPNPQMRMAPPMYPNPWMNSPMCPNAWMNVVKDYIDPDHIAHEILDRRFRAFSLLSKQEIKGLLKRHTEHRATKYGKGMAGDLRRLALRLEVPIPAGIDPGIIDEMRWPNATQQSLVGFGRKVILGEIQRLGLRGGWLLQKAEPQEGDDTVLESAAKSLLQYRDSDPKERASIERWSFDWKTHSRRAVNYVESATSKASLQSEATKRFLTLSTTINGATRDFNRAELRDLIAEHDSREEVRKCLLEDKLLPPIEIIPEDSKLVILSYRFSSTRDIKKRSGKVSNFFEKVESSLEEGGILPGLQNAKFEHCIWTMSATKWPPIAAVKNGTDGPQVRFTTALHRMPAQSTIVIVIIGLEGLSVAMEGWKNLVNSFYSLRFVLVIAEKPKQWYRASVTWSYQDWYGLHLGRFWATIDLAILIDENRRRGCRLYEGVVK